MFEPVARLRPIAGQLVYFGCWVFVTTVGVMLNPSPDGHGTHQELGLPPCPCVLIFNRPCPGCGLTTSFTALLHGRFRDAFKAHWLGPFLYAMFTLSAFGALIGFIRRRKFTINHPPIQNFLLAFTAVFLIYGVARFALLNHYQSAHEAMMASGIYPR
ncbi:MAG: DUF2752 domain-containing protein [Fimbriimonadaceae bacterium]